LVTPAARRRALVHLRAAHRCSGAPCGLVGLAARSLAIDRGAATMPSCGRACASSPGSIGGSAICGCMRCFARRAGDQSKRTYRLYQAEGLAVRRRPRRRPPERERLRLVVPQQRNQRWSMDFVSDALWTGRRFRCLCLVDDATRESPALLPDFSIGGARVVRMLDELACRHGLPEEIVMDNGPEFTGRALFAWSARTGVRLRFIQPGRPVQNAFVESFIGRFRDECLNQHWFGSLAEAALVIEA
jgi:putative transposase